MSIKERLCIHVANELRIKCTRKKLKMIKHERIFVFDGWKEPLAIEWEPSLVGKLQQIALVPCVYLLIIPACILTQWLVELTEHIMRRITLWKIIYRSKYGLNKASLPEYKTLWCLWQLHGIERRKFGEEHAAKLLAHWIVILYGKETADQLDIEGRRKELWRVQTKTNIVYFEGKGTIFITYKNLFDYLLGKISEELPPYA